MKVINQVRLQEKVNIPMKKLLMCSFAVWPLFWNVWGLFKITVALGDGLPFCFMWLMGIMSIIVYRKMYRSFLFIWIVFIGTVVAESISTPEYYMIDMTVMLCGILLFLFTMNREQNYKLIIKCLFICGFIVSVSIVIDSATGIFRNVLIGLYTDRVQYWKTKQASTGGILPHTGSAGCFIFSGLPAYITLVRLKGRNSFRIREIMIVLVFVASALLIQKRGFIVDTAATVILLKAIGFRREDLRKVSMPKTVKRILLVIAAVVVVIIIYFEVPLIHDAVDSLVGRFTTEDKTMSGRTDLYALAFELVKGRALTGIGWRRFRAYTSGIFGLEDATYSAHNVFIQLFCETGFIGLGMFLFTTIYTLVYGIRKYRKLMTMEGYEEKMIILQLGIFMQSFFLTYCMSGNPLYDYNFLTTYFNGILLTLFPVEVEGKSCGLLF